MKKIFTPFITVVVVSLLFASCQKAGFRIEGHLTEAADTTLYLEHVTLTGIEPVDSARLDSVGHFAFKGRIKESPDFYRLRVGGSIINLAVDSTETITITASLPEMVQKYTVKGSETCERIRVLTLWQMILQQEVMYIQGNNQWNTNEKAVYIQQSVDGFKRKVTNEYILKDPASAASYFAVFQTLGSYLLFNPVDDENDVKIFAAVATSWDAFHPGTSRTENLHNIVIEGQKTTRRNKAYDSALEEAGRGIQTVGVLPVAFSDIHGKVRSLSELKGQVVLLDFTAYGAKGSGERTMLMRELYSRYHARGLEIYEVSLDGDEHYWKTSCQNLPWICVWDPEGTQSSVAAQYNVTSLPECFLINRNNELVIRGSQTKNLVAEIEKLLAE